MAHILDVPKSIWFMIIIIFAILGSLIGVTTHIDSLQFQEIETLNEKLHALDKQVAINNERLETIELTVAALRDNPLTGQP